MMAHSLAARSSLLLFGYFSIFFGFAFGPSVVSESLGAGPHRWGNLFCSSCGAFPPRAPAPRPGPGWLSSYPPPGFMLLHLLVVSSHSGCSFSHLHTKAADLRRFQNVPDKWQTALPFATLAATISSVDWRCCHLVHLLGRPLLSFYHLLFIPLLLCRRRGAGMNEWRGRGGGSCSVNERAAQEAAEREREREGGLPVPWGWVLSEADWVAFPVGGVVKWKMLRHWAAGVQ